MSTKELHTDDDEPNSYTVHHITEAAAVDDRIRHLHW